MFAVKNAFIKKQIKTEKDIFYINSTPGDLCPPILVALDVTMIPLPAPAALDI